MKTTTVAGIGALCVVLVLGSACAARTQGSSAEGSGSRNRISPSELDASVATNAFAVVQQLRPQWLRSRGPTSLTESTGELPTVYVDNVWYGDLAVLQDIPIAEIAEVRYINGPDATIRWGTGLVGGVIEVIRKRK